MDLYDAAWQLSDLLETNRSVLLRTEPVDPDFTAKLPFKIIVHGQRHRLDLDVTPQNIVLLAGIMDETIFNKDTVNRLYAWNFKSLATYFHHFTGKFLTPGAGQVFLDLKIIENFLNVRKNRPENLVECVNRIRSAVENKGWQSIYKQIHLPLALRVLPSIETKPLLNEASKRPEYPHYEIEGQFSGRMNCVKKFLKNYLPHNMGPEERKSLKPRGYGLRFAYSDFHNCEIAVLQWLSKDPVLKDMLESDKDFYSQAYELITGDACDSDAKRKKAKIMLLAVVYGSGASGLGKAIAIPEEVAKELIRRIQTKLPTAFGWLEHQQAQAKKGVVTDYFGRPRTFEEPYKARNFSVQGVAATLCQEKLIELHGALNDPQKAYIAFSVHDGFGTVVAVQAARETYKKIKEVSEAESKLCPGLKMKVEVKFGARLDAMKVLWRD
jgi:hypothetical protein